MKWLFNFLNQWIFKRHCFFCDKIADIDSNILQYKVSDYSDKLQIAYVCSECSKDIFISQVLADKMKIVDDAISEKDETKQERNKKESV